MVAPTRSYPSTCTTHFPTSLVPDNPLCPVARLLRRSYASWSSGKLHQCLHYAEQAVSQAATESACTCADFSRFWLATALIRLRRMDRVHDLLYPSVSHVAPHSKARIVVGDALARALLAFTNGELDKAAALGKQALAQAQRLQQEPYSPAAHLLLASISFRRRDIKGASVYVKRVGEDALLGRCAWLTGQRAWLFMQIREAESGAEEVAPFIGELVDLGQVSRDVLSVNPAVAPWLVRLCLKINDRAMARLGANAARKLASMNPEVQSLVAAAVHAEGLFDEDLNALWKAAETHQDPWARASALEDVGKHMVRNRLQREQAIEVLERSGESYLALGASRDVSRIKSSLRDLEVRHGFSRWSDRPKRETGDLTETEFEVAQLAAQGLTNSQVAAQLFLSPHTIAFHLRKIFPKLGVVSRVELARTWSAKFDGG